MMFEFPLMFNKMVLDPSLFIFVIKTLNIPKQSTVTWWKCIDWSEKPKTYLKIANLVCSILKITKISTVRFHEQERTYKCIIIFGTKYISYASSVQEKHDLLANLRTMDHCRSSRHNHLLSDHFLNTSVCITIAFLSHRLLNIKRTLWTLVIIAL